MLAVVSMVNAGIGLAMGAADLYRAAVLGLLVRDPVFIASIASLIVISTVVAMHLMNTYQPLVSAATAAVVYCLEPVFATAWSIGLRTETLTMITVGGGAVILVAVWIVVRRPGREG
jgi:drug/metabolite transporter (DMT)-like permease